MYYHPSQAAQTSTIIKTPMEGIIAKSVPCQILPTTKGARKLAKGEWRNSTWAEYMKVPLEDCEGFDKGRLVGELGYNIEELAYISELFVRVCGVEELVDTGWGADYDCACDGVIWGRGGGLCLGNGARGGASED